MLYKVMRKEKEETKKQENIQKKYDEITIIREKNRRQKE